LTETEKRDHVIPVGSEIIFADDDHKYHVCCTYYKFITVIQHW